MTAFLAEAFKSMQGRIISYSRWMYTISYMVWVEWNDIVNVTNDDGASHSSTSGQKWLHCGIVTGVEPMIETVAVAVAVAKANSGWWMERTTTGGNSVKIYNFDLFSLKFVEMVANQMVPYQIDWSDNDWLFDIAATWCIHLNIVRIIFCFLSETRQGLP